MSETGNFPKLETRGQRRIRLETRGPRGILRDLVPHFFRFVGVRDLSRKIPSRKDIKKSRMRDPVNTILPTSTRNQGFALKKIYLQEILENQ